MKFLILALAAIAAVGTASAGGPMDSYGLAVASGQELLRKVERMCPGYSAKRLDAVICYRQHIAEETMCSLLKKHHSTCMQPVIEHMEDCMPEDQKFIPEFVSKSMVHAFEYICHQDGEHIFELANQCIMQPSQENLRTTKKCINAFKNKFEGYMSGGAPTKAELCSTASAFKNCFISYLRSTCHNNITRESFIGIFDALLEECKDVSVNRIEINDIETF